MSAHLAVDQTEMSVVVVAYHMAVDSTSWVHREDHLEEVDDRILHHHVEGSCVALEESAGVENAPDRLLEVDLGNLAEVGCNSSLDHQRAEVDHLVGSIVDIVEMVDQQVVVLLVSWVGVLAQADLAGVDN